MKGRDLICRWGGEEFLVIFTQISFESGLSILEQIREAASERTVNHNEQSFGISFSAGAVVLARKTNFEQALKQADQMLYQAKQSGRNRVMPEKN